MEAVQNTMLWLAQSGLGLTLGLAAIGSALGIGMAGRAAAGAWGKEARMGKPLNFQYIILTGMPLSQTIYAFVLMLVGLKSGIYDQAAFTQNGGALFGIGLGCGLGELASAWMQGLIGASAVRSISDSSSKPLAFSIIAMGIAETVGLFAFVFMLLMLP